MYYLDGINAVTGASIFEGPFRSFEEVELYAATHDIQDYALVEDDPYEWDEFSDWDDWEYYDDDLEDIDWVA